MFNSIDARTQAFTFCDKGISSYSFWRNFGKAFTMFCPPTSLFILFSFSLLSPTDSYCSPSFFLSRFPSACIRAVGNPNVFCILRSLKEWQDNSGV